MPFWGYHAPRVELATPHAVSATHAPWRAIEAAHRTPRRDSSNLARSNMGALVSKLREMVAYGVAALALVVAVLAVSTGRNANSESVASWVQAVGSIAAIVIVTLPVLLQHSLGVQQAKAVTLATVEEAYATMSSTADRCVNPGGDPSEWWVPQWSIINDALAQCPIQTVGSAEATRSFIEFRELFHRASGFDPSDKDSYAPGLVAFVMTNASRQLEALKLHLR